MIDLYLITGFLGSGKTTLLTELARRAAEMGRRYIFVVNEFSSHDVDGRRIKSLGGDALIVPGGSIFCSCLASEFIAQLSAIPVEFGHEPFDAVVVEASGIANPSAIDKLLHETGMDHLYRLGRVIAMVDPGTIHKILKTLPAAREQLAAADCVLINKCDLYGEGELAAVEGLIAQQSSAAAQRVVDARFKGELLIPTKAGALEGEMSFCADPAFAHHRVAFTKPVDLKELSALLERHREEIYRVKGAIETTNGWCEYDFAAGRSDIKECQDIASSEVVIITVATPSSAVVECIANLAS